MKNPSKDHILQISPTEYEVYQLSYLCSPLAERMDDTWRLSKILEIIQPLVPTYNPEDYS